MDYGLYVILTLKYLNFKTHRIVRKLILNNNQNRCKFLEKILVIDYHTNNREKWGRRVMFKNEGKLFEIVKI